MNLIRRVSGLNFHGTALAVIASFLPNPVLADESTEHLFGNWTNISVNGHFGKDSPWLYTANLSLRATQTPRSSQMEGYLLSGIITQDAFGYRFDEHHSVFLGYAFQYTTPPLARQDTTENRAWEQHTFAMPTPAGKFQIRSRLEQRTVNIGPGASVRLRELIGLNYPLDKSWSLVASNEAFFNLNTVDWGPTAGFDQNRLSIGIGYQFNPTFRTEIGYMNQYIDRDLAYDRVFHLVQVNFVVDIPD